MTVLFGGDFQEDGRTRARPRLNGEAPADERRPLLHARESEAAGPRRGELQGLRIEAAAVIFHHHDSGTVALLQSDADVTCARVLRGVSQRLLDYSIARDLMFTREAAATERAGVEVNVDGMLAGIG